MAQRSNNIFRQLVSRSIRTDYVENLTGFAWLILQPLLLLSVYAFVFTSIFQTRIPDAQGIEFLPYLAVAFWPWTAFSEAVLKASGTVTSNAALIGKVAFPSELLTLSTVAATFLMHMVGYAAVLIVLQLMGTDIHWLGVLASVPLILVLGVVASGIGLIAAALQVFVRDVAQILPPFMTFWFFMTPILYSEASLPAHMLAWIAWNPMSWFMSAFRKLILFGDFSFGWTSLAAIALAILLFWVALRFFRKLSGHFEDFL